MRFPTIPWWLTVQAGLVIGIVVSLLVLKKPDVSIALSIVALGVTFVSHDSRGRRRPVS